MFIVYHVMANPNSTKILELSHVTPFTDSPDSTTDFSLSLTFLDTFWFKFSPVECLFFYSLPETKVLFFNPVLRNLKHSFSLTLNYFLPLIGNLTWSPSLSPMPILTSSSETMPANPRLLVNKN